MVRERGMNERDRRREVRRAGRVRVAGRERETASERILIDTQGSVSVTVKYLSYLET